MRKGTQLRFSVIRNVTLALTGCAAIAGCQSIGNTTGQSTALAPDPNNTSYK